MIKGLVNAGATQTLERMVQFTGARHGVLTHNIANLDTPYFRPRDLDPKAFQSQLRDAVERRRRDPGPMGAPLQTRDSRSIRFQKDGLAINPLETNRNILFHDRNNRDVERIMQDLAENTLAHTAAIEFLKGEFEILRTAIRERV
jgi:flagellar basal-body rod protein FlgB